ncbi:hypothetical protein K505DRAFT_71313 [Melanomma pulvis-pyrius CBS 109.77]|uniref:Uncharacterized protein n=1 Tax=Melanomma pulvis-pyrius CBS 109.77 TaxID=1314802 RepID=A0A6A6XSS6_9PLEO|nr:hypothetical protein K505DRAFT_71313 [Melanomma pulvis-pyrius CBS 109.77]
MVSQHSPHRGVACQMWRTALACPGIIEPGIRQVPPTRSISSNPPKSGHSAMVFILPFAVVRRRRRKYHGPCNVPSPHSTSHGVSGTVPHSHAWPVALHDAPTWHRRHLCGFAFVLTLQASAIPRKTGRMRQSQGEMALLFRFEAAATRSGSLLEGGSRLVTKP